MFGRRSTNSLNAHSSKAGQLRARMLAARAAGRGTGKDAVGAYWGAAGAALGALVALVLFAPAAWLARGVHSASSGQIVLADARGTVWNGSSRFIFTGGAASRDATELPQGIAWTLRPALSGVTARIAAPCCTSAPLAATITPRLTGADAALTVPLMRMGAAVLAGLGTPWNTIAPQGQLQLQGQALTLAWREGRLRIGGSATMDLTDMSSRLSTLAPLGDYRLTLQGGDAPTLTLETLKGGLELSGAGQWVGARLRFNGEASAAPERLDALSNLLNIIGRRNGPRSVITLG